MPIMYLMTLLKNLDESVKKELDIRYQSLTTEPRKVHFIDRVVADSRTVALKPYSWNINSTTSPNDFVCLIMHIR